MEEETKLMFNLQLFADDGSGGDDNGGKGGDENKGKDGAGGGDPENKPGKTDKDKDVDIQAKIDEALKTEKAKWEKEYKEKAEAERKENERLSKLSEQERKSEELKKKQKELEAKEKELAKKDMQLEMAKVLSDRHIPQEFSEYLMAGDSTETLKRVTTFEKAFKKAVDSAVNERLKGKPPKAGGGAGGKNDTTHVKNGFFEAIFKNQSKR